MKVMSLGLAVIAVCCGCSTVSVPSSVTNDGYLATTSTALHCRSSRSALRESAKEAEKYFRTRLDSCAANPDRESCILAINVCVSMYNERFTESVGALCKWQTGADELDRMIWLGNSVADSCEFRD
jgi:hypothetical protein